MTKIMFVCHGNICRSPMAEFIFKDLITKNKCENEFSASSSATSSEEIYGGVGNPVYPPARRELEKHNIFCGDKRATKLNKDDYENYDLFICMDSNNIRNTMRIFGNDKDNKVHKLLEYIGSGADVTDPWYSGDFTTAYNDIYKGCTGLLKHLTK